MFFCGAISSKLYSTWLLCSECFRFDGFHEQKTEGLVELTTYMFTNLLIGYIQYYLQYLHLVVRCLVCYMLCLTTPNLILASLLTN